MAEDEENLPPSRTLIDAEKDTVRLEQVLPGGEWCTSYLVTNLSGTQPVIAEVRIYPAEGRTSPTDDCKFEVGEWSGSAPEVPVGGITRRLLRSVSVESMWKEVRPLLPSLMGMNNADAIRKALAAHRLGPPVVAKRNPDWWVAFMAAGYANLLPHTKKPILTLADEAGLSPSTTRSVINEARRRGFLAGGKRGRAGGYLTDAGKAACNWLPVDESEDWDQ
jgi:hypothetical protein